MVAVVALVVLLTLVVGMILAGQSVLASGRHEMRGRGATAMAEAGVEYGYWQYGYKNAALPFAVSRALGDGTFSVTVTNNGTAIQRSLKLVSTATLAGDTRTITRVLPDPFYTVNISGTVFEDVNYGGGAGRSLTASGGARLPNVRVELYDASGNFSSAVLTDSNGLFTFSGVLNGASGSVRVVSSSVRSSRTSFQETKGVPAPILTFRTQAPGAAVTDHVGGEDPSKSDAGNGSTTLSALASSSTLAQCVAPVSVGTDDLSGVDFGFNFDTVVNTNNAGAGSLRQVLINSNAFPNSGLAQAGLTAGVENVVFMLPDGTARAGQNPGDASAFSSGIATFSPMSPLPRIYDALILDASRQPGWSSTPILEIRGDGAGSGVIGLRASASGCTFQSLTINRFGGAGIALESGGTISGCWIGTTAGGSAAAGNGGDGVQISGGGVSRVTNCVISGNAGSGLTLSGGAMGVVVTGNSLGTDTAGTTALANGGGGIVVSGASGCTLGGSASGAGNVISGNAGVGVTLSGGASGNAIWGNYIGTNASGTAALGNGGGGVVIDASSGNAIGGMASGAGNVISGNNGVGVFLANGASGNTLSANNIGENAALNGLVPNIRDGIVIESSDGNTIGGASANVIVGSGRYGVLISGSSSGNILQSNYILYNASVGVVITATPSGAGSQLTGNAIYANGGIGVDLKGDGVSANDGVKIASSPNAGMDFPVFTSATLSGSTLTVAGYVGSAAGQATFASARVEIFKSDGDSSGYGEGSAYLGALTANASGNFSGAISVSGLASGSKISAIAIDSSNNSSEFGPNFTLP